MSSPTDRQAEYLKIVNEAMKAHPNEHLMGPLVSLAPWLEKALADVYMVGYADGFDDSLNAAEMEE